MDKEYNSIMNVALKSYRKHRDKEKADNRKRVVRNDGDGRRLRVSSASQATRKHATKLTSRPKSSICLPTFDAIKEVGKANNIVDRYLLGLFII